MVGFGHKEALSGGIRLFFAVFRPEEHRVHRKHRNHEKHFRGAALRVLHMAK